MKEKPGRTSLKAAASSKSDSYLKSSGSFRSCEEWKSALMTLPDSNFFELIRSVFGNIKTPFNKQRLLEDLANLLSRDEIRKVIAAYITEKDHKIIAAVSNLGDPAIGSVAPGILESFFSGEFSYAELHAQIVNLEERLIIYRFREDGVMHLALNPVLEEVLSPFIADTGPILPSFKQSNMTAVSYSRMNDSRYMAALFSFLQNEEELFKPGSATRAARKKCLDDWKKIFPRLDLNLIIRTLLLLGLFRINECRLLPYAEKITDFIALTPAERQEYWAAAMYLCLEETSKAEEVSATAEQTEPAKPPAPAKPPTQVEPSEPANPTEPAIEPKTAQADYFTGASKIRLRGIANFIHRFRAWIDPERSYPETTLKRLEMLLEKNDSSGKSDQRTDGSSAGRAWGYHLFDYPVRLKPEQLLTVMEHAGILEKDKNLWKTTPVTADASASIEDKPVIAMDSAYSVILYPEISFSDAMTLGIFCSVKEIDKSTVRFELSRESAVQGFDKGMKAAAMSEILNRLSGGRIDTNLAFTLKDWETRYQGVVLRQGLVLSLDEEHLYLTEAEPVSSMISQTLAPGVFLLSTEEKTEVTNALRKAGVDIIARPPGPTANKRLPPRESFPKLVSTVREPFIGRTEAPPKKDGEAEKYLENFRRLLDRMKPGKQEREELSARIERRLVLSEVQMEATSIRYEKTEARLLDYRGKAAIAKNAIESGSLVEVSWTDTGNKQKHFTGIAQALEKTEGDCILVLKEAKDSAKTIRLPLGKISLLRRIKQSIFGG